MTAEQTSSEGGEGLAEVLHRAFHDHWNPSMSLDLYADSLLWRAQAEAIMRILADRLSAVQAERDSWKENAEQERQWCNEQTSRAESAEAEVANLRAESVRLHVEWHKTEVDLRAEVEVLRGALDRVEGLAKAQATSCQAAHRADHARNWLDVLAIIERAALTTPPAVQGEGEVGATCSGCSSPLRRVGGLNTCDHPSCPGNLVARGLVADSLASDAGREG